MQGEKQIQLLDRALKGEMAGDGVILTHPRDLQYIRVTSIKTFEMCPFTWAIRNLVKGPGIGAEEERTGSAAIGTALHSICEDFLMKLHAGKDEDEDDVIDAWKLIPEAEQVNLTKYLNSLMEIPMQQALVVEERLFHRMLADAPPISGQIDLAGMMTDADLLIVDHKSNRTYNDASFWRVQLQQLFYAWMARLEWPDAKTVHFRIGYPNFGTFVQWQTTPSDDDILKERFAKSWERMLEYAYAGVWPRRINDECNWCPAKDICPDKNEAVHSLRDTFLAKVGTSDVFKRLQYIKDVEKIVRDMRAVLEGEAKALITAAPNGELTANGQTWKLEHGERRKASFLPTLEALNALGPNEALRDMADEIFSVKVGGLEKAAKAVPALRPAIATLAVKTPNKEASIVSRPAGLSEAPPAASTMMIGNKEVKLAGDVPPEAEDDPF